MSDRDAEQTVDIFFDLLNIVFSKYLKHWRENREIDLVQAQLDLVNQHANVVAFEYHPLEHVVNNALKSIQRGEEIDLAYVYAASKYESIRGGEELLAKTIANKYNGKSPTYREFLDDIQVMLSEKDDYVVDEMVANSRFDAFSDEIAEYVKEGKLSSTAVVNYLLLDEDSKMKMELYASDLVLLESELTLSKKSKDDRIDTVTGWFLKELMKSDKEFRKKQNAISTVSDKEMEKAFLEKDFSEFFKNNYIEKHHQLIFQIDPETGNERTPEERQKLSDRYTKLLEKPYNVMDKDERALVNYFYFADGKDSVVGKMSESLTSSVVISNMHYLKDIKHGELHNQFTQQLFSIKQDVDGKVKVIDDFGKDMEASQIKNAKTVEYISLVKNTFEDLERGIRRHAKENGDIDSLRGLSLIEYLKETTTKGELVWKDKERFVSLMNSLDSNFELMNIEDIVLGIEDSSTGKWVVPWNIINEGRGESDETVRYYFNAFVKNNTFMQRVWDVKVDERKGLSEDHKYRFRAERASATNDFVMLNLNPNALQELVFGNEKIQGDLRKFVIGHVCNLVGDNYDDELAQTLINNGVDIKDPDINKNFFEFYDSYSNMIEDADVMISGELDERDFDEL